MTETVLQPNGAYAPFAYATAPNSALYRRIMHTFVRAKERFTVHLRPEDIRSALDDDGGISVTDAAVAAALDSLAAPTWGNLVAFPDSSRVTAIEDFYRRRMLYQLSHAGEAAERALRQYDDSLGARGALQAVALEDIAILLRSLFSLGKPGDQPIDEARVHQDLRSLRDRFTELADNAVLFMGSVQRSIDLQAADLDAFLAYKDSLIGYLERFIADLVTRGAQISQLLKQFSRDDVQRLCTIAARREAQDAAPGLTFPGADVEAHQPAERAEASMPDPLAELTVMWLRRWEGLTDWFVATPARDSEAKLLRARARSAIPALLAVVATMHDRHSGRSDRSADFLTLASWFSALPDDEARHRLWRGAFGLAPARHLSTNPETEEAWERARVGPSTTWAESPGVQISSQLRRTGTYERRGRQNRVTDRTGAKALLADRAREQSEQTAAARRRILTDGPVRLSAFAVLDRQSFHLFLALLGDGLAALRPDLNHAEIYTSDGGLRLTITRLPGAPPMRLETVDGALSGPDHLVDIGLVGLAAV